MSCMKPVDLGHIDIYDRHKAKTLFFKTLTRRNYRNYSGAIPFLESLSVQNKKIILHGAGWHTAQMLHKASDTLRESIVAITDANKAGSSLCGFDILHPDMLSSLEFDCVCMSTDIYQKPMKRELVRHGVAPLKIIDLYRPSRIESNDFINNKLCNDKIDITLKEIAKSKNPCIVVSNSMGLNHPRLLKYLAREYDLFVLTSNSKIQSIDIKEFSNLFRVCLFDSVSDLVYLTRRLDKGFVITINGIYWNSLGAVVTLATSRPSFTLFVDFLSSAYASKDRLIALCDAPNELFAENVLWRYSRGVIFKESYELASPIIDKFGPKNSLQFLDYCDGEIEVGDSKISDAHLSFVYAGGLLSQKAGDPNCNHHLSIRTIANTLIAKEHSFTIYNAYDEGLTDDWEYYKNINTTNFEYQCAVPITDLAKELARYDIGVVLFDFSADGVENRNYYKHGGFSKIMAYIEAELPIVISKETEFMAALIEEYEIGIAVKWDNIDKIPEQLTQENIIKWKSNIKRVKHDLSYGHNIKRLVAFLDECL